jgi:hypothetical protein
MELVMCPRELRRFSRIWGSQVTQVHVSTARIVLAEQSNDVLVNFSPLMTGLSASLGH